MKGHARKAPSSPLRLTTLWCLLSAPSVCAWTSLSSLSSQWRHKPHRSFAPLRGSVDDETLTSLKLPPELEMMTNAFATIPDEKTRHKQLLYMANQLPAVGDEVRVAENKVPGCLSTVYVDCHLQSKDGQDDVVDFVGDSDGLLTKGLLALLIRGLSGCTPEQINSVDPKFIQVAKISQTLTPGRNNGFLNMLAVMKKKANEAVNNNNNVTTQSHDSIDNNNDQLPFEPMEGKPIYNLILSKLTTTLKPTSITLTDNSHQHAGHAGSKGFDGESHFSLQIVSDAFDGLNLVKRHKLIYMFLGEEVMGKIHALQIRANTPQEINS